MAGSRHRFPPTRTVRRVRLAAAALLASACAAASPVDAGALPPPSPYDQGLPAPATAPMAPPADITKPAAGAIGPPPAIIVPASPPAPVAVPPTESGTKPSRARILLLSSRTTITRRGQMRLSFSCQTRFRITLRLLTLTRGRAVACPASGRVSALFALGQRTARRAHFRRRLTARVTISAIGQPMQHLRVLVRWTGRGHSARVAAYWSGSNAALHCDANNNGVPSHTVDLHLNWKLPALGDTLLWASHQTWFEEWWEGPPWAPINAPTWRAQNGVTSEFVANASPFYGPYRIASSYVVEWSTFDGVVRTTYPLPYPVTYPIAYRIWVRAWVRLWLWDGSAWYQETRVAPPTLPVMGAPDYCFNA